MAAAATGVELFPPSQRRFSPRAQAWPAASCAEDRQRQAAGPRLAGSQAQDPGGISPSSGPAPYLLFLRDSFLPNRLNPRP